MKSINFKANSKHDGQQSAKPPNGRTPEKEKSLELITGILTSFAIVLHSAAVFLTIRSGTKVTALMVCALAISAFLPMQYKSIKAQKR